MKHSKTQTIEKTVPCYGAFSEQWKYDDYERRKKWLRHNRSKLIAAVIVCCAIIMTAAFMFVK